MFPRVGQLTSPGACPDAPPPAQSAPCADPGQASQLTIPTPPFLVFSMHLPTAAITSPIKPTWAARRSPGQAFQFLPLRGPIRAPLREVDRALSLAPSPPLETLTGPSPGRFSGRPRSFSWAPTPKQRSCPAWGLQTARLRADSRELDWASNPAGPPSSETLMGPSPGRPSGASRSLSGASTLERPPCPTWGHLPDRLQLNSGPPRSAWTGGGFPLRLPRRCSRFPLGVPKQSSLSQPRPLLGPPARPQTAACPCK
jgi:hypothetical protein